MLEIINTWNETFLGNVSENRAKESLMEKEEKRLIHLQRLKEGCHLLSKNVELASK